MNKDCTQIIQIISDFQCIIYIYHYNKWIWVTNWQTQGKGNNFIYEEELQKGQDSSKKYTINELYSNKNVIQQKIQQIYLTIQFVDCKT